MIHICYGLSDRDNHYSKFTGTSMVSIFENTQEDITIHILHDSTLSMDNRDKFNYIVGRYHQQVKFYNVEELHADKIAKFRRAMPTIENTRFSIATLYRLILHHVISIEIDKIIYLDSDIIVNLDIGELWQINLEDNIMAVVTHFSNGYEKLFGQLTGAIVRNGFVNQEDYFNAGLLMINLNLLRNQEEDTIINGTNFLFETSQLECNDQDILNYCFSKKTLKLPVKYNRYVNYARLSNDNYLEQILHYCESDRDHGVTLNMEDKFSRLWFKYFTKTPWFNCNIFDNLLDNINKVYKNLQNRNQSILVQMTALLAGKKRAFFTEEQNISTLAKIFEIKQNEEIIICTPPYIIY